MLLSKRVQLIRRIVQTWYERIGNSEGIWVLTVWPPSHLTERRYSIREDIKETPLYTTQQSRRDQEEDELLHDQEPH